MRATKSKHYYNEKKSEIKNSASVKKHKLFKSLSFVVAIAVAVAVLILPTTTFAPGVDAFENSRVASLSVGGLKDFSVIITDNCVEPVTVPVTQSVTEAEKTTVAQTTKAETTTAETEAVETKASSSSESSSVKTDSVSYVTEDSENEVVNSSSSNTITETNVTPSYSGSYIFSISDPDPSYNPKAISLTDYDRDLVERVVMREMGYMGYANCTLVAQCIRDAMIRSNTTSMDRIISEYGYGGSLSMNPNTNVKNAVSYIFDQTGSAVQHRVLCYYTGSSAWHETQNYVITAANCRFFDLWY